MLIFKRLHHMPTSIPSCYQSQSGSAIINIWVYTHVLWLTLSNWLASPSPCEGAAHTTTNKLSVIQPTYFNTMPQLVELTARLRVVLNTMSHLPIRPIHRLVKNATVRRAQPQNFRVFHFYFYLPGPHFRHKPHYFGLSTTRFSYFKKVSRPGLFCFSYFNTILSPHYFGLI